MVGGLGRKAALPPGLAQFGPTKSLYEPQADCCLAQRAGGWGDSTPLLQNGRSNYS